jgi:hypothetical protein
MPVADARLPLQPLWLSAEPGSPRAGALGSARVALENAGTATWRSRGSEGLQVSYHWLDMLGNPIVWDGVRTPLPRPLPPGERLELDLPLRAPRPPGRYRLAFDLVEEHRFWLEELGCSRLEVEVEVAPRIVSRRLAVVVHGGADPQTQAALAAQEEPLAKGAGDAVAHLVAGAEPSPDWSRRLLDAHAEGFAAVGPALRPTGGFWERRRAERLLAPWAPSGGRNPRFEQPLLLPSLLAGIEPIVHLGYPAYDGDEDALFDGRIEVRLPTRSGRPRG